MTSTLPLLKVNGDTFDLEEAARRFLYRNQDQADSYIDELLVRAFAEKNGISNADEELKVAIEELRYDKGLESAQSFQSWLQETGQTLLSVQNELDYQLLLNKVKGSFSEEEVEQYLDTHRAEFDKAELYGIQLSSIEDADALLNKAKQGENFHVLAMEHSEDAASRSSAGYLGDFSLADLPEDVAEAVSKAQVGDIVGPFSSERGHNLVKVGSLSRAALPDAVFDLRDRLLQNLVEKLKAEANIEGLFPTS